MEENELELHPEAVKDRQDTYSSLTDLSGIDIFTDEFRETQREIQEERQEQYQKKKKQVFVEEILREENKDSRLAEKLFLTEEKTILRHEYEKNSMGWPVMEAGLICISVLAVSALYAFFFQDKKRKKQQTGKG